MINFMQQFIDNCSNNTFGSFAEKQTDHNGQQHFLYRQLSSAIQTQSLSLLKYYGLTNDVTDNNNIDNFLSRLEYFNDDLKNSANFLNIQLTPNNSFTVGQNIATTCGSVVFKNDLFELIQYKSNSEKSHSTPLLFVPSVINKYYILDLNDQKSMVKWLVEKNYTVFMISWRNPGPDTDNHGISDYILKGVTVALSVITNITKKKSVHAVGYCLGGTLLALTVAYYNKKGLPSKIKTTSFFATLLDFTSPGDLAYFINNPMCQLLLSADSINKHIDGRDLNVVFNLLRENTLYWNYYISKYFSGTPPTISDFLFWSGDGMNLNTKFCHGISNEFYKANNFSGSEGIQIGGVTVNIESITSPSYFVGTQSDHITPWEACFMGASKLPKDCQYTLGKSGHVAGIINPPQQNKYGYWTSPLTSSDHNKWLENAVFQPGSWWEHWYSWLVEQENVNKLVPSPELGNTRYPPIYDAPGQYVLEKC
jgi:polyhydroxyalkanoate synthase